MPEEEQDYTSSLLGEFNTKLRDIEEKQKLTKERILLISQNLVELKEEFEKEKRATKDSLDMLKSDNEKIKRAILRITEEMEKKARKSELEILANQMKMFSPLEFARIEDVRHLLKRG